MYLLSTNSDYSSSDKYTYIIIKSLQFDITENLLCCSQAVFTEKQSQTQKHNRKKVQSNEVTVTTVIRDSYLGKSKRSQILLKVISG